MSTGTAPVLAAFAPVEKPLSWFKENPENPRDHPDEQIPDLIDSLQTHGFYKNVVARPDGTLLAGHGMILAARTLRLDKAPVIIYDGDDVDAIKLMVGDNHLSETAVDNKERLLKLNERILQSRGTLMGTGFSEIRLQELRNALAEATQNADISQSPPEYDENIDTSGITTVKCPECGHEFPV